MAEEQGEAVAEEVGGGLEAGDQEEDEVAQQFLAGDPVRGVGGDPGQVADQVAGRPGQPLGDQLREVGLQFLRGGVGGGQFAEVLDELQRDGEIRGEAPETVAVGGGDTEQFADHLDREAEGEGVHEVDGGAVGAPVGQFVEQPGDRRLDRRAQGRDPAGVEGRGDERADPAVVGGVALEDRVAEQHDGGVGEQLRVVGGEGPGVLHREGGVAQHLVGSGVPGHQDRRGAGRGDGPEFVRPRVERVGVEAPLRGHQTLDDRRTVHAGFPSRRSNSDTDNCR
ncbi:hypothetical protein [Streptomyces sp. NRRL S-495]|uniref:hypothetical protein n=1 Tax=Streptomyces sp. NRRL S-495 TaxID=1609133 RepID=UPI0005F97B20|nr:hypothetical protein [Streptomyces sp. NRRL S-495]KJY30287.1 hypothetical protein VR45_27905 [Streptomyces sp. NRRL S-495]